MKRAAFLTLATLIVALILTCCSDKPVDARLDRVQELLNYSPDEALDSLGAVSYDLLEPSDKHLYDFLLVKVSDKAYVTHTSDSLIRKVIDYEAHNKSNGRYAEALYYGGRVYSDMGDYPTSLKYFQQALDEVEDDVNLEVRILSQTGRLLNTIRLHDKAIPYLEKALTIDSLGNDPIGHMYDTELLGALHLHAKHFKEAEKIFRKSRQLAERVSPGEVYQQNVYIAAAKYYMGELDSALIYIRDNVDKVYPSTRNNAVAYAAAIYLDNAVLDTAYIYAKELISDPIYDENREFGYKLILTSDMKKFLPQDSLDYYISAGFSLADSTLSQLSNQETLLQNSFYNYKIHERERRKADETTRKLIIAIACMVGLVLIMLIVILYLKDQNKSNLLKLHEALYNLQKFHNSELSAAEAAHPTKPDSHELRVKMVEEILSLQHTGEISTGVSPIIIQSPAYAQLQTYIANKQIIVDDNPLWKELENAVHLSAVNFKHHLLLLTGGKLKDTSYHIAILIKCGVTPTQMTHLMGRTKGTISYRRESLCRQIFGENLGVKVFDGIIASL